MSSYSKETIVVRSNTPSAKIGQWRTGPSALTHAAEPLGSDVNAVFNSAGSLSNGRRILCGKTAMAAGRAILCRLACVCRTGLSAQIERGIDQADMAVG